KARVSKDGDGFRARQEFFVRSLQNHHGGMVLVGDAVYGTGSAALLCGDFKTGKGHWQERGVGKGSVAHADGPPARPGGAVVEATPAGYKEKSRFDQPERSGRPAWPHPVIAGGRLYLRDWDVLLCYDVKEK